MKDLQQKIAYLQGLAKGMDVDDSKEGKLLTEILDVLEDMAENMALIQDEHTDLENYVENLDSDLTDLEDDFYGEEDCDCDYEDDDDDFVEVTCPNCNEEVCFDADILYDEDLIEVTCPECGTVVFVNGDEEDFEDDFFEVAAVEEAPKAKKETKKDIKKDTAKDEKKTTKKTTKK